EDEERPERSAGAAADAIAGDRAEVDEPERDRGAPAPRDERASELAARGAEPDAEAALEARAERALLRLEHHVARDRDARQLDDDAGGEREQHEQAEHGEPPEERALIAEAALQRVVGLRRREEAAPQHEPLDEPAERPDRDEREERRHGGAGDRVAPIHER